MISTSDSGTPKCSVRPRPVLLGICLCVCGLVLLVYIYVCMCICGLVVVYTYMDDGGGVFVLAFQCMVCPVPSPPIYLRTRGPKGAEGEGLVEIEPVAVLLLERHLCYLSLGG